MRKQQMNNAKTKLSLMAMALLLTGCDGSGGTTCSDFDTQPEAQANYHSDLDADNDGIACEHLPDSILPQQSSAMDSSSAIGDYTLLGSHCDEESCTVQAVNLSIVSEDTMTLCLQTNMENTCYPEDQATYTLGKTVDKVRFFDQGSIELGSVENGHIKLNYGQQTFVGHNILMTDQSEAGFYHHNGVREQSDGSFSLTSYSGQLVRWDNLNQLTIKE